jgi:hypothetical protein
LILEKQGMGSGGDDRPIDEKSFLLLPKILFSSCFVFSPRFNNILFKKEEGRGKIEPKRRIRVSASSETHSRT